MNPDHDVDARSPYFKAVAIDFDGTLAEGGPPAASVLAAVRSARSLGLRLLLVTGRTLPDLWQVFPEVHEHFDLTVAENGAILRVREGHRRLARPVDPELARALRGRHIPVQVGEVILACDAVHDAVVFEEIRRLDLDCQLIRNRGALMVVPAGVTKASGLGAGLRELGLSAHSVIAIGDAENDLAPLEACELGVAVANAVPVVRQRADLVLDYVNGTGVTAFLEGPIVRGKQSIHPDRWRIRLGLFNTVRNLLLQPTASLRGGDRQLNRALHAIVMWRTNHHAESKHYMIRRRTEGKSDREIRRCLKASPGATDLQAPSEGLTAYRSIPTVLAAGDCHSLLSTGSERARRQCFEVKR